MNEQAPEGIGVFGVDVSTNAGRNTVAAVGRTFGA